MQLPLLLGLSNCRCLFYDCKCDSRVMRKSTSARACAIFYSQSTPLLWLSKICYLVGISKIFYYELALTKHKFYARAQYLKDKECRNYGAQVLTPF